MPYAAVRLIESSSEIVTSSSKPLGFRLDLSEVKSIILTRSSNLAIALVTSTGAPWYLPCRAFVRFRIQLGSASLLPPYKEKVRFNDISHLVSHGNVDVWLFVRLLGRQEDVSD